MKRFAITVALIGSMSVAAFATNGTKLIGYGPKMSGRGATGIGIFDSPTLMVTNPAGLSFMDEETFGVAGGLLMPTNTFKNGLNDKEGKSNIFPMGGAAYVGHQLRDMGVTWGVGLFTQGGMGADYELNHSLFRNSTGGYVPQTYHSKLATVMAGPSASYKVTDKFAVGASLQMMYSTLEFNMPFSMSPSFLKGAVPASMGGTFGAMFQAAPLNYTELTTLAKMSDLSATAIGARIGLAYKLNDQWNFGFSYAAPTELSYDGGKAALDMTAQFTDAFGKNVTAYAAGLRAAIPTLDSLTSLAMARDTVTARFVALGINPALGMKAEYDLVAKLKNPQTIGFGASYKMNEKWNFSCDLELVSWADAYDQMALELTGGANSNINRLMGNTGDFNVDFPLEWKNSTVVKMGAEYNFRQGRTFRFGYAYGSNPVPSSTLFSVFPAIIQHHLTVGSSRAIGEKMTLHVAYEYALTNEQTTDTPNKIAKEYNGSKSTLNGALLNIGLSWK